MIAFLMLKSLIFEKCLSIEINDSKFLILLPQMVPKNSFTSVLKTIRLRIRASNLKLIQKFQSNYRIRIKSQKIMKMFEMKFFIDNDNLIRYLKWFNVYSATWPLRSNASILKKVFYGILWCCYGVHGVTSLPAFIKGMYFYRNDLGNMMKSFVEFTYVCEALFLLTYCKLRKSSFQVLIGDMQQFSSRATSQELALRRNNLRRLHLFYPFMSVVYIVGGSIFIVAPLIIHHREIPLNTMYPFSLEKTWAIIAIYMLNTFTVMQAFCPIIVDLLVITILWYAAFKFMMLGVKLQNVTDINDLRNFVLEHQDTIRYVALIDYLISPIVFKSIIAVCVYMITCSLLFLKDVPLLQAAQFYCVTILSIMRLLVCSSVAQAMTDASTNLISFISPSIWLGSSSAMQKNVLFIIQRCQKPITVSASSLVPALSLPFCGLVMYKTFSYFMTLRAILQV